MRAISLWQPWATAIALGSKTIETRDWSTEWRGPLAIHAAKRRILRELDEFDGHAHWRGALHLDGTRMVSEVLPFGAVVAVCNLIGCLTSEELLRRPSLYELRGVEPEQWEESQMGNFADGRYGWVLADIRPLSPPVPFKGAQGFFHVPDSLLCPPCD